MKYLFDGKVLDVKIGNEIFKVKLSWDHYRSGKAIAIMGTTLDGEPFSVLTVNMPGYHLGENEIIVKTWSENEQFAIAARESGYFEQTGRTVPTGYVEASIWKIKEE
jgi:hypothetical protein